MEAKANARLVSWSGRRYTGGASDDRIGWMDNGTRRKTRHNRKTAARVKAEELVKKIKPVAGLRPNPIEVDFAIPAEDATSYRFFDCRSYEVCLGIACIGKWRGFTCRACPVAKRFGETWSRIIRRVRLIHDSERKRR